MSGRFSPEASLARFQLTVKEAAHLFNRSPSTIRNWAADGLIHSVGRTMLGAKLYAYPDLLAAEKTMREQPQSHRRQ